MAITDINISEQLETSAPSIKYEGNEGPQSPQQEQRMAELKREYMQYVFEQKDLDEPIMSFEEWYQAVYQASKMSVQAPQEQITAEEVMTRAPAAFGGIMDSSTGRRAYGLGSIFKKITRPFKKVAKSPLGKAALLYAGTAGLGNLAGGLGGAHPWMSGKWLAPSAMKAGLFGKTPFLSKTAKMKGAAAFPGTPGILGKWGLTKGAGSMMPTGLGWLAGASAIPFTGLGMGEEGLEETAMSGMKDLEFDFDYGEMRKEIARAVQSGDKVVFDTVLDKYNLTEGNQVPFWEDLRTGSAQGGRIGLYAGGQSIPSDYTMEDARKTSMQDKMGGITEAMKIADLYRKGDVGQFYAAQGGRIGYDAGGRTGHPPITTGQKQVLPQMPGPQAQRPNPMPAPQPNRMAAMNPMMGGMHPMMGGRGMNPMMGGRRMAQEGGLMDLGGMEKDYRNDGGFVPIGGEEKADDVPARLSKNEFVFTADAVRGAGGGDIDKGAEIMENVMENLEQGGQISEESQGLAGAREMFDVSERLSEVV